MNRDLEIAIFLINKCLSIISKLRTDPETGDILLVMGVGLKRIAELELPRQVIPVGITLFNIDTDTPEA